MADTITPPDQDIDSGLAALSTGARVWLLVVACLAVSMVIFSMVALTTLSPMLTQFPEPVRERALGSLAEALAVSEQIGPLGPRLTELARTAFLHAMDSSVTVLAIVIVTASVFIGIWSPGRDGRQSGVVRRLRRLP